MLICICKYIGIYYIQNYEVTIACKAIAFSIKLYIWKVENYLKVLTNLREHKDSSQEQISS